MTNLKYLLLTLGACLPLVLADEPDRELHTRCLHPTVRIEKVGDGGTAVVVKSVKAGDLYHNAALTCAHVATPAGGFHIKAPVYKEWRHDGYSTHRAYVYERDERTDIAVVLFTSDRPMPTAEIAFGEKLYVGSRLSAFGCGEDDEPRLGDGKITSLSINVNGVNKYRTSILMVPGDSGGPVYHKKRLVGLGVAARVTHWQGRPFPTPAISVITPIDDLKSWDEGNGNAVGFTYKDECRLPAMPFLLMRIEELKMIEPPKLD